MRRDHHDDSCEGRLPHPVGGSRPVTGQRDEQVGRWSGKDIVQVGAHADGTPTRWLYTEIAADSFRWTGEALNPDGKTWRLEGEFRARRVR